MCLLCEFNSHCNLSVVNLALRACCIECLYCEPHCQLFIWPSSVNIACVAWWPDEVATQAGTVGGVVIGGCNCGVVYIQPSWHHT